MSAPSLCTSGIPDAIRADLARYLTRFFPQALDMCYFFRCGMKDEALDASRPHAVAVRLPGDVAEDAAHASLMVSAPINLSQLKPVLETLIGQTPTVSIQPLWNGWQFDLTRRIICRMEAERISTEIHLTEKEALLLDLLMKNSSQPIDKALLLGRVWGYAQAVDTRTVEAHIYRLRQKLEPILPAPDVGILTDGEGYRWCPPENAAA